MLIGALANDKTSPLEAGELQLKTIRYGFVLEGITKILGIN
jgi:hypothetical protein